MAEHQGQGFVWELKCSVLRRNETEKISGDQKWRIRTYTQYQTEADGN
jgi:hypothetical protein